MTRPTRDPGSADPRLGVRRLLGVVTRVESEEVAASLGLLASVFLILLAYYLIKPAREGWLAVSPVGELSKIEIKAYSSLGQVLLLVPLMRFYSRLVASWPRGRLVARVTIFLGSNLVVFWLVQPGLLLDRAPWAGIAFYLWVGVFNVFIVAQFWAYVADFYSTEAGRRLIPLIALGANAGAVAGAWLAERLVKGWAVSGYDLLLLSVAPLALSLVLLLQAERRGPSGQGAPTGPSGGGAPSPGRTDRAALALIQGRPLLAAIAGLTVVFGWVGANGENLLFSAVQNAVELRAAAEGIGDGASRSAFVLAETTGFYGNFYFQVNLASFLLQALVASRLVRLGGFGVVFLCLPLVSVLGYLAMAVFPVLAVIQVAKVTENSTNYSIHNTARGILWLPMTTEEKFKAKPAVDTLFVRCGDGLAALTVLVAVDWLGVVPIRIFWLNVGLGVLWVGLALWIARVRQGLLEEAV
ncbi:MAG TPA: hypothetical protein PLW10_05085 [Myxococcota bacterium]|nr:hypothetical protein [Myxococcota bacterium]